MGRAWDGIVVRPRVLLHAQVTHHGLDDKVQRGCRRPLVERPPGHDLPVPVCVCVGQGRLHSARDADRALRRAHAHEPPRTAPMSFTSSPRVPDSVGKALRVEIRPLPRATPRPLETPSRPAQIQTSAALPVVAPRTRARAGGRYQRRYRPPAPLHCDPCGSVQRHPLSVINGHHRLGVTETCSSHAQLPKGRVQDRRDHNPHSITASRPLIPRGQRSSSPNLALLRRTRTEDRCTSISTAPSRKTPPASP